jgi:hypothetical protein
MRFRSRWSEYAPRSVIGSPSAASYGRRPSGCIRVHDVHGDRLWGGVPVVMLALPPVSRSSAPALASSKYGRVPSVTLAKAMAYASPHDRQSIRPGSARAVNRLSEPHRAHRIDLHITLPSQHATSAGTCGLRLSHASQAVDSHEPACRDAASSITASRRRSTNEATCYGRNSTWRTCIVRARSRARTCPKYQQRQRPA